MTKTFDIAQHVKAGFRDWVNGEFPEIKKYAEGQMPNYPQFVDRIPEIYSSTTLAVETIAGQYFDEKFHRYMHLSRNFERRFAKTCDAQKDQRDWRALASDLCDIIKQMESDLGETK